MHARCRTTFVRSLLRAVMRIMHQQRPAYSALNPSSLAGQTRHPVLSHPLPEACRMPKLTWTSAQNILAGSSHVTCFILLLFHTLILHPPSHHPLPPSHTHTHSPPTTHQPPHTMAPDALDLLFDAEHDVIHPHSSLSLSFSHSSHSPHKIQIQTRPASPGPSRPPPSIPPA